MKKHKWIRKAMARRFIVAVLLIVQLALLLLFIASSTAAFKWIPFFLSAISICVGIHVINELGKPGFKMTWLFTVLIFPVFGGLLYLLATRQASGAYVRRRLCKARAEATGRFEKDAQLLSTAAHAYPACATQQRYLQSFAGFPIYQNTAAVYYPSGESFYDALLADLQQAERYIFLEFFIIEEGVMWNSILEVLRKKAEAGLDVRLMFDDMGCFLTLPKEYPKYLESMGIKCQVFSPFTPVLSVLQNNRDHRKIASIDGKVAFTGGANLADEYINAYDKHGRWRDAAIRLSGDAAWSLTLIFLELWRFASSSDEDCFAYRPAPSPFSPSYEAGTFVQPYADNPLDNENVSEHVYMQIIQNARDYVYISTPYLIIDDTMISALTLAAKSGVDVRILTPQRWDKRLVHITTRSYYRELIKAGVKIYEYKDGFNHAKTFVSDDRVATVGTVNLDYRSLYLHYECGVAVYGGSVVAAVRDDFLRVLSECVRITPQSCAVSTPKRLFQDILRIFAPLM